MAPVEKKVFGTTSDTKEPIDSYILDNGRVKVELITYGAAIRTLFVPDSKGKLEDIVLGHDTVKGYEDAVGYLGVAVGRVANRIGKGKFSVGGTSFQLAKNNGENALHGGLKGLSRSVFKATVDEDKENTVHFAYTSPSGEDGYPGDLLVNITYSLGADDELTVNYKAMASEPTPVNLTNHSYFNLGGHARGMNSIHDHRVAINADNMTPVSEALIPTGELKPVAGTPFDLRKMCDLGQALSSTPDDGFDHNLCLNGEAGHLRFACKIEHPASGRSMEVHSDQPGIQFYTANFLPTDDSLVGKGGAVYRRHGGFCLETQNYPDAVNQKNFPNCILSPGNVYRQVTKFKFGRC